MTGHDLTTAREQLVQAVAQFDPPPFYPLNISPWVGMALLQKAVRRGRKQCALRAAATLLHQSPERLWRRIGCIAYEDVGVGDLDTVAMVTTALAGKRFRASLGDEWKVASFLVCRLARARKCRGADDLLMLAEGHPAFAQARADLATRSTGDLISIAIGSHPLPVRALALWFALGTNRRPSSQLRPRRGDPAASFDGLGNAGISEGVVEIAREGFKKTSEVLAPFVALLHPQWLAQTDATTEDDALPPEMMIGDIPSWAFDVYSRDGKAALAAFIGGTTETAQWVRAHIPPRQRVTFLGGIVFRVEGGLVRSRLRWPIGDQLRRLVDLECAGSGVFDATELLSLMRADIPALNRVRAEVLGSVDHA